MPNLTPKSRSRSRTDGNLSDACPPIPPQETVPGRWRGPALRADAIAEFQRLCRQEYGIDLTPEEAQIKAGPLVELFRVLLRPPR